MKYGKFTIVCLFLACLVFAFTVFAVVKKAYVPLRYQVSGIKDKAVLKNVMDTLLTLRSSLETPITVVGINRFKRKAPALIQEALKPYGYFHSEVTYAITRRRHGGWLASYHVILGPQLPITLMDVQIKGQGIDDPAFDKLLMKLPLAVGEPLNTIKYEKIKDDLNNLATERGYFDAQMVKSQIRINLRRYTAKILIIFDTGKRYRFGETTFSKTPFAEDFLQRFLRYHVGEPYDAKKLEKTQSGMVKANYFNQVLIKAEPKDAINGEVPIHIKLIMRKSKQYILGLGYGSDTGFRGTIGVALRYIGHYGHRFHALIRASQYNTSGIIRYMIPGFDPANDLFTIGAGASHIKQSTGNANNVTFGLSYTVTRGHWKNSLTLAYLNERYNILGLPFTTTQLVFPTFDTKYINSDRTLNPKEGISVAVQLSGADHDILSRTDFFQVVMHLKTLYTIDVSKTRFLFRSDAGHTSITNLYQLPLSLQLLAGGSRSVRGYGYNSIGPGRNLTVGSFEIQQRVYGNLYLAGFVDAGAVWNGDVFRAIAVGSGPALAVLTPVGVLELSVAEAITQPKQPWSIQFTMGAVL